VVSALNWLASAPWWVPAIAMFGALGAVWFIVWKSLKTERQFSEHYQKSNQAIQLIDDFKRGLHAFARRRRLMEFSTRLDGLERSYLDWSSRPALTFMHQEETVIESLIRTKSYAFYDIRSALLSHSDIPLDISIPALAGKDLTVPQPQENGQVVVNTKEHKLRVALLEIAFMKNIIQVATNSTEAELVEIERKIGAL
jgi:hypothetical protein